MAISTLEIRAEIRQLVDPLLMKFRQELLGSGVTFGRITPGALPPTTIVVGGPGGTTDPDTLGYIKGIKVYSGGTLISTDQTELSFVNAGVTTVGHRTTVTIPIPPAGYTDPLTTNGDLLYRAGGITTRLPIGTSGQFLQVDSGLPEWRTVTFSGGTITGSGMVNPMTTEDDIIIAISGGVPVRLAKGSVGQVLTIFNGHVNWADAHVGMINPMTARGDIIYGQEDDSTNVALNSLGVSATTNGGYFANDNQQHDGNDSTYAISNTAANAGSWYSVDLLSTQAISALRVSQRTDDPNYRATSLILQRSSDNSTWIDVQLFSSLGGTDSGIMSLDVETSSRYWRILATAGGIAGWCVRSFELYTGTPAGYPTRLPISTSGYILRSNGLQPEWGPDVGFANPMTTAGDIIYALASGVPTRLPIGSSGEVLGIVGGVPDWISVSGVGSTGIGIPSIMDKIYDVLSQYNGTLIDQKIEHNDYIALIHMQGDANSGWTSPTNAQHTVATGKKLVVLSTWGSSGVVGDAGSRKARLRNTTDSVDVVSDIFFSTPYGSLTIPYTGDVSDPTMLFEVAASKNVSLDIWNTNSTKRAIGGIAICREITVSGWVPNHLADPIDYVTTPNGARISSIAASPDINGAGGAGFADEFDSGSSGITWGTALSVEDVNTTIKSHLYLKSVYNSGENLGTKAWAPAAAFDIRTKLYIGSDEPNDYSSIGPIVTSAGNSERLLIFCKYDMSVRELQILAYTYAGGGYTQRGNSHLFKGPFGGPVYTKITRDSSDNCSFYYSFNGILWQRIATQNFVFTVANRGLFLQQATTTPSYYAVDWQRADV